jgi:hypothetical protein
MGPIGAMTIRGATMLLQGFGGGGEQGTLRIAKR